MAFINQKELEQHQNVYHRVITYEENLIMESIDPSNDGKTDLEAGNLATTITHSNNNMCPQLPAINSPPSFTGFIFVVDTEGKLK